MLLVKYSPQLWVSVSSGAPSEAGTFLLPRGAHLALTAALNFPDDRAILMRPVDFKNFNETDEWRETPSLAKSSFEELCQVAMSKGPCAYDFLKVLGQLTQRKGRILLCSATQDKKCTEKFRTELETKCGELFKNGVPVIFILDKGFHRCDSNMLRGAYWYVMGKEEAAFQLWYRLNRNGDKIDLEPVVKVGGF